MEGHRTSEPLHQGKHSCCAPAAPRSELSAGTDAFTPISGTKADIKDMIRLAGGSFLMGTEDPMGFPQDGEGPVREVTVSAFLADRYPVTNADFSRFVD